MFTDVLQSICKNLWTSPPQRNNNKCIVITLWWEVQRISHVDCRGFVFSVLHIIILYVLWLEISWGIVKRVLFLCSKFLYLFSLSFFLCIIYLGPQKYTPGYILQKYYVAHKRRIMVTRVRPIWPYRYRYGHTDMAISVEL